MALIRLHSSVYNNPDMMGIVKKFADKMELVGKDGEVKTFRITHDEVPKEDKVITLDIVLFYGIDPFVIEIL